MAREWVSGEVVCVGCQIGASGSIQHQMRHIDRRRAELCKVLHIEKNGQKVDWGCNSIQRVYF